MVSSTSIRPARRLLLAGAFLSMNCSTAEGPATEIVVVTESDLEVPAELDYLEVRAIGPNGKEQRASSILSTARGLPRRVVLRHATGNLGPLHIVASGQKTGREIVSRVADTAFQEGRQVVLHLALLRSCVGIDCGGQTCTSAGCVSTDVLGEGLPELGELPTPGAVPFGADETDMGARPDPQLDAGGPAEPIVADAMPASAAPVKPETSPALPPMATTPDASVTPPANVPAAYADAGVRDAGPPSSDASSAVAMEAPQDAGGFADAGAIRLIDGCVPSERCVRTCQSAPRSEQARACACLLTCIQQ
jgi:hypothetical protein